MDTKDCNFRGNCHNLEGDCAFGHPRGDFLYAASKAKKLGDTKKAARLMSIADSMPKSPTKSPTKKVTFDKHPQQKNKDENFAERVNELEKMTAHLLRENKLLKEQIGVINAHLIGLSAHAGRK